MFLGHYAVAFGAKRVIPMTSLGTLFAAAAMLDLIWPVLVIAGIERVAIAPGDTAFTPLHFEHYPYSHSLIMSLLWALLFGGGYFLYKRSLRGALTIGALVLSHWILDAVSHRPDMPVTVSDNMLVGLGLWNSVTATLILELAMFTVGLLIYLRTTRGQDYSGKLGLLGFVLFLLAIYAGAIFGPPPPSANAVAWSGMGQWLVILFAAWVDRHRTAA